MANITLTKILNGLDSQSGSLGIAEQIKMSKESDSQTLIDKLGVIDDSIAELEASSITTSNIGTWVGGHVDDSTIEFSSGVIKVKNNGIAELNLSQEVQNKLNSGGKTYTGESGVTVSGTVISLTDRGVTDAKVSDELLKSVFTQYTGGEGITIDGGVLLMSSASTFDNTASTSWGNGFGQIITGVTKSASVYYTSINVNQSQRLFKLTTDDTNNYGSPEPSLYLVDDNEVLDYTQGYRELPAFIEVPSGKTNLQLVLVGEMYYFARYGEDCNIRVSQVYPNSPNTISIKHSGVTTDKIAYGAVKSNNIYASAVTTVKIANSAVTMDKLSADVKAAIESGGTELGAGSGITITAGTINVKESGITEGMISGPLMDLIHGYKLSLSLGSGGVVFTDSSLKCTVSYGGGLTNLSNITVASQDSGVYEPTMTNNTGTGIVGSTTNYNGYPINANATLYGEAQISATTKLYVVDKMYFGFATNPTSVPEVQTPKRTYKGDFTATGSGKCFLIIPTGMWTGEPPTIGTALNAKSNNYGVSLQCVQNSVVSGKGYLFALGHAEVDPITGQTNFVHNELEQGTITITIS